MQLDMQGEGLGLHRTVGTGARQAVLPITTGRQPMHRRCFIQQTPIYAGSLPIASLEMRAEYAQVDQGKRATHQTWQ